MSLCKGSSPSRGSLIHAVSIKTRNLAQDTHGGQLPGDSYNTDDNRRCSIEHLTGLERIEASRQYGTIDARLIMDYYDVQSDQRLTVSTRAGTSVDYEVVWVDQTLYMGRQTVVWCRLRND